jgi:hypothetical protein
MTIPIMMTIQLGNSKNLLQRVCIQLHKIWCHFYKNLM